jgi:hypothetical protein
MWLRHLIICVKVVSMSIFTQAIATEDITETIVSTTTTSGDFVSYSPEFFDRFSPQTALDMVRQIPGFQLQENEDGRRGFAGGEGNLLINDRRPSAKADLPSSILARIPAANVERIELIRGQVRGIDLRGQSSMVNIIMHDDNPAIVKWETAVVIPYRHGPVKPILNVALSDKWRETQYNTGLSYTSDSYGRSGLDQVFNSSGGLVESRYDGRENRVRTLKANLNTISSLEDGTIIKFNTVLAHEKRTQLLVSDRRPEVLNNEPRIEAFDDNSDKPSIEVGLDAERGLVNNLTGKVILLYSLADEGTYRTQRVLEDYNQISLRVADGSGLATEFITRMEFDWTGFAHHSLNANLERAYNSLDGTLISTLDAGSGPLGVIVPGANSFVKEIRWDFLLQDIWSLGQFELTFGLGAEASTISQTGDAEQERDFFFLKPQMILMWTPEQGRQVRMRIAREVAQLNLADFISATLFEDDDLALGNPDIQPDTTWVSEISHERRLGSNTVIRLRAFHHWITNVLDLLPITPTFEVPGNIGDGRRWGVELEATLPLEWMRLTGAKLNIKTRWQDSTVIDPVTGKNRMLSGQAGDFPIRYDVENRYALSVDYRQDFENANVAWGWNMVTRSKRPLYKVNELQIYNEAVNMNAFIETTRWFGVKVQLNAENILNAPGTRDRTVFVGRRDISPMQFRELRSRNRDQSLILSVSGLF